MDLKSNLIFYERNFIKTEAVTSGIYLIKKGIIGKSKRNEISSTFGVNSLRRGEYAIQILNNENEIMSKLHAQDFSVPKSYGLYEIRCMDNNNLYPMLLMEYWENGNVKSIKELKDIDFKLYKRAKELRNNELREIRKKGFTLHDELSEQNTLYSIEKDKICLIDFEDWRYNPNSFLNKLRND